MKTVHMLGDGPLTMNGSLQLHSDSQFSHSYESLPNSDEYQYHHENGAVISGCAGEPIERPPCAPTKPETQTALAESDSTGEIEPYGEGEEPSLGNYDFDSLLHPTVSSFSVDEMLHAADEDGDAFGHTDPDATSFETEGENEFDFETHHL